MFVVSFNSKLLTYKNYNSLRIWVDYQLRYNNRKLKYVHVWTGSEWREDTYRPHSWKKFL